MGAMGTMGTLLCLAVPWGGNTLSERLAGIPPLFPRYALPDGPPDARGPLEVLVGTSQESWENSILDSGSNSSHSRVLFT